MHKAVVEATSYGSAVTGHFEVFRNRCELKRKNIETCRATQQGVAGAWRCHDHEDGAGRANINATFMQPFVSYTTKTYTTFGVNTESTYDWESRRWTVPLNLTVQQLLKFGSQPVAFTVGGRYYAEKPEGGPDWGLRFAVTLLFPK